jgi:hypothetical protein
MMYEIISNSSSSSSILMQGTNAKENVATLIYVWASRWHLLESISTITKTKQKLTHDIQGEHSCAEESAVQHVVQHSHTIPESQSE